MAVRIDSEALIPKIRMEEQLTNGSPPDSGYQNLFVKSDGVYAINSDGVVSDLSSDWIAYTPWWITDGTQPTLGDGSIRAYYKRLGKDAIAFNVFLVFGSTTNAGSGTWILGLPVRLATGSFTAFYAGGAGALDQGTSWWGGSSIVGYNASGSSVIFSGINNYLISNSAPFTWANGDQLFFSGIYPINVGE